jgi:hypothetical protein
MIILDTNVVSEVVKVGRDGNVLSWLNGQSAETLYLTATSLSELLIGIEILPAGKRRDGLSNALSDLVGKLFHSRILPFDRAAAVANALLVGKARAAGKAVSIQDGQIAAIAHVNGFSVATRDTSPFMALGVSVINPWDHP